MDERPSVKKIVSILYVPDLKLVVELCKTHLNEQVHRSQCVSLHPIKGSHVDLVLFQIPQIKP